MEIKTCEQYVLAELEKCKLDNSSLVNKVDELNTKIKEIRDILRHFKRFDEEVVDTFPPVKVPKKHRVVLMQTIDTPDSGTVASNIIDAIAEFCLEDE